MATTRTPSNDAELAAFIARHRVLLTKEREAEIARSSLLLTNCSQKLLEQKGLALGGLGTTSINVGLGGKTLIELERPSAYHTSPLFPPHTFRPGDLARIEENVSGSGPTKKAAGAKGKKITLGDGAKAGNTTEGVVYKVSDTRIIISIDPSTPGSDDIDLPERCRIVKLANSVTYDRMDKALDQLERTILPPSSIATSAIAENPEGQQQSTRPPGSGPVRRTKLIDVLLGLSPPSEPRPSADLTFFDPSLNPSQQAAVRFVLAAPEVACIHGPPGTGKTHTLVEVIRQLTSVTPSNPRPQRILVCGASNLAVDNILERLLALPAFSSPASVKDKDKSTPPTTATRIGHPARVMANSRVLDATLDAKAGRSDQAELAKDVKTELESTLDVLAGRGKGAGKGKKPRGAERRKMWDDVKALRKEYRKREGGVVSSVLGGSQVIVATCHSAGGKQLRDAIFDVVIIDEATQAVEAVCWVPIFKANKLILAGDPMQLPPTVLSLDRPSKSKQIDDKKKNGATQSSKPSTAKQPARQEAPSPLEDQAESDASSEDEDEDETLLEEGDNNPSDFDGDDPVVGDASSVAESRTQSAQARTKKEKRKKPLSRLRPPRTLETTLFDRLEKMYGPGIKRMLNVQYRMHAQIAKFPSRTLYASRLKSHSSVTGHLLRDLPNVRAAHDSAEASEDGDGEEKEVLASPVVFFDTAGCEYFERTEGEGDEGSRCNENEAAVVKAWVDKLIAASVLPSQIAVITPYQAQVTLLTSIIRPVYGPEVEIGTVDGMQGREKDAVVISLVRSNESREVGFLKEKRRLNVAMTRAKRSLCIVGDSETVKHGSPFLKKWMAWLEAHADVRYAGLD